MSIEREHDKWTAHEDEHGYIRARLRLVATEEGGRSGPIASGYRSHWTFPTNVDQDGHDAPLTLEAGPDLWLEPGQETMIRLHPLVPYVWPVLTPGLSLKMCEGSRVVGYAEIVEIASPTG